MRQHCLTRLLILFAIFFMRGYAFGQQIVWGNNASFGNVTLEAFDLTTGSVVAQFLAPNLTARADNGRGIAVVGTIIYYSTANSGNVYVTDSVTHADLGIAFTVPVSGIACLAWDGTALWVTPYDGTNRAFRYSPTGTLLQTITLQGHLGAYYDGFEIANGKIIANRSDSYGPYDLYDLSGNLLQSAFITTSLGTGIAFNGTNYIVSQFNQLAIYDSSGTFVRFQSLGGPLPSGGRNLEDLSIASQPSLIASPASLTFAYAAGQAGSNTSQSLSLSASSGVLTFTAFASTIPSGGKWLSVVPLSGSTPAILNVTVAQHLVPGTYSGQITVTSPGALNSPLIVPVSLTVTLPLGVGPSITNVSPVSGTQGQLISNFRVVGTGFQPGASLSFGGVDITVNSITSVSPGRLNASIRIGDSAPLGAQDVIVTNPNLQQAQLTRGFAVAPLIWNKLSGPWSSVCDSSFGAIAVDPNNSQVIYLGSSDVTAGCGIYKSTDGGQIWHAIDRGLPQIGLSSPHYPAISKIAVSPSNSNILYLGTFVDTGVETGY